MILGIGTDLVLISRMESLAQKDRFLQRYFTEEEEVLLQYKPERLAGNFAAKEAVVKAMGTGFRGFGPKDVEILREEEGKPQVHLRGPAAWAANKRGVRVIHVSISHEKEYAMAFAIAER